MADEQKVDEGTHTTEPDTDGGSSTPATVKRTINNREVEVSPELATILDEQKEYIASQQTKAQTLMEQAKAEKTSASERLQKDIAWYSNNPKEAWASYVPLVQDENGGYRGDPSLLVQKAQDDDVYGTPEEPVSKRAMTPDPMLSKLAEMEKKQLALENRLEREAAQKSVSIMDTVLLDPKYSLANNVEVFSSVRQHFDNTGRHATKQEIIKFAQSSHDAMKIKVSRAGNFTEKPRFDGPSAPGGMPREKVRGVPGNIFGTHAERQAAVKDLAERLEGN